MQKVPPVLSYAQQGLTPRTLVLGVRLSGAARAYLFETILQQKLIQDRLGGQAILIAVGPDGESVRGFRARAGTDFLPIDESIGAPDGRRDRQQVELSRVRDRGNFTRDVSGTDRGHKGLLVRLAAL